MIKKILIISNLYPPHYLGGYELLCKEVVDYLISQQFEVNVLTSDFKNERGEENIQRKLKLAGDFGSQPLRRHSSGYLKIYKHNFNITSTALNELKPDLVFLWSQLRLTTAVINCCKSFHVKTVMTLNDDHVLSYKPRSISMSPKRLVSWLLDKTLFRKTTLKDNRLPFRSCIISDFLKKKIEKNGIKLPEVEKIYQGIAIGDFPYKKESFDISKPVKILYCGQLSHHKQVHILIKAVDLVNMPVELRILGAGEETYEKTLRDLAAASKQKIEFVGKVLRKNLVPEYQNSDIFIFTSLQEPFGLTFIEAMAVGVPVISTLDGGHCECLEDQVNCLTFTVGDEQELADKINEMVSDGELRKNLSINARKMVQEKLDIKNYFKEITDFVHKNLK